MKESRHYCVVCGAKRYSSLMIKVGYAHNDSPRYICNSEKVKYRTQGMKRNGKCSGSWTFDSDLDNV